MKVLITGGYGFLGSKVCDAIENRGHTPFRYRHDQCNLLRFEDTIAAMNDVLPDAVIHLAAVVGGIGANQREPGRFAYENLMMGLNVIEACRAVRVRKMILAGTICMYPKFTPVPFKEENLWNGYPEETNAPYGIAKKALMVTAQGYRKEYGCNMITLMPVNLYGPGDNFKPESSHVIPAMMLKFHEAKKLKAPEVTLWGDGSPTREFLFVDDAAEAFALALEKYDGADPINIGTGGEITMSGLADIIKDIVGYTGRIVWDKTKPNGQPRRCLDVSKAQNLLGWKAKTDLTGGLKKTYEWFESYYSKSEVKQEERVR